MDLMGTISAFIFRGVLRLGRSAILCLLACGLCIAVLGQDPEPTPVPQPTPPRIAPPAELPDDPVPVAPNFEVPLRALPSSERVGIDNSRQLPLTLEEAIKLALENNNDIDASRNDRQIAEFNLRGSRGVFDPLLAGESYYESATIPTASLIGGAVNGAVTQRRFFGSAGISGFTPGFGGSYAIRFDASRFTTSNTNAFLNPQYPSVLSFSYVQPLFRDRSIDSNRRNIEISKRNVNISDSQFKQRAANVVAAVEQAYWDLTFALRFLQVQIDALKQARDSFESNQRLVEKGVLAPIEIVAATERIATLEQAVHLAQEGVTRTENTLKTLLLNDRSSLQWSFAITPVSPIEQETPRISLEIAVEEAIRNRPEIEQLEEASAINAIDQRFYRNQAKPTIDLVGSYASQGLAGTETPAAINPTTGLSRVPPNLVGGLFASLGNLAAQDYPTYRIGVSIGIPWGNTVAKANLGRSLVEADRLGNIRAQTEQVIEAEVRNAIQALRSAEARLSSAVIARTAAEQLAESEERQFRVGITTFYLVQQRQIDLIIARSRELQAQTDRNKAISEFHRAIGNTLTVNNITLR
jgi:HAE1 family hydrophobic/amphiphilic exporter-1